MKSLLILFICVRSLGTFGQFQNAVWIGPAKKIEASQCPVFFKNFSSGNPVRSASLTITAHGLFEAVINGKRAGKAYFTPGWTNYNTRLQYQQYNVTSLIRNTNIIVVTIAGGWYRGAYGGDQLPDRYGSDASLLFRLDVTYKDGSHQYIVSDSSWKSGRGPIIYSDIYNGEVTDTRIPDSANEGVKVEAFTKTNLCPTIGEPVTKQEVIKPLNIHGNIIDFGQNLAGWVHIKLKGNAGDTIKIFHAEALDAKGDLFTGNLREAAAEDIYILNGTEQELEPHFTYHGFRYARVEGFIPSMNNCFAIAVHTNLKHSGSFECSDPMINHLQHNIEWSLNSNFFDIPTDCPQRSERLGWTGDAQIFCATAAFNRDVLNFYKKWLTDLKANQGINGGVPVTIPDLYHFKDSLKGGVAGWGDAATIIPFTLYNMYGDTGVLRDQYHSMKAWVDYINNRSKQFLWKDNGYGDWYAQDTLHTPLPYIDQCFFIYSTSLLIQAAQVLQLKDDVAKYSELLSKITAAFKREYVSVPNTQAAYVLGLQFGLLPDSAVKHLVELIHENHDHLSTGFLATPFLLPVLTKYDYNDLAYTLLEQRTMPSWLYPITRGATTTWEKWDAIKEDGSFDTCSMNHYAYGAVGNWLYQTVAGIQAAAPGYRKIIIAPQPGGNLSWVKSFYECPYGKIISNWKISGHTLSIDISIPPGTTAEIDIPGGKKMFVRSGWYHFTQKIP